MIYNNFRRNCLLRLLILTATITLLLFLILHTDFYVTMFITLLLGVMQIFSLFQYLDATNRMVSQTFHSLLADDFSDRVETTSGHNSFNEIGSNLNKIIEKFQKNRVEQEQQFEYLKTVIQQSGVGLVSVRSDGWINIMNKSARKILGIPRLTDIKQLEEYYLDFCRKLVQMVDGEKCYYTLEESDSSIQIAIYAQEIKHRGERYFFYTLQNIGAEREEIELQAWKDLIRVLSHEIMNSVTPISSLAATATLLVGETTEIPAASVGDLRQALHTIDRRSQGLMQFVQNYRKFARIPAPEKKIIHVGTIFSRLNKLLGPEFKKRSIKLKINVEPENLLLNIDQNQIEQVLLNLLNNSIEALEETQMPEIVLNSKRRNSSGVIIDVKDNGRGIHPDVLPKIFIPFFTTRPEGSGIGLSLSRQIMRLHGGSIHAKSIPGSQTVFSLIFSQN